MGLNGSKLEIEQKNSGTSPGTEIDAQTKLKEKKSRIAVPSRLRTTIAPSVIMKPPDPKKIKLGGLVTSTKSVIPPKRVNFGVTTPIEFKKMSSLTMDDYLLGDDDDEDKLPKKDPNVYNRRSDKDSKANILAEKIKHERR